MQNASFHYQVVHDKNISYSQLRTSRQTKELNQIESTIFTQVWGIPHLKIAFFFLRYSKWSPFPKECKSKFILINVIPSPLVVYIIKLITWQ